MTTHERSPVSSESSRTGAKRRVSPLVALAILEVIQAQDLPTEILEAEDPSITIPRRLGLSDVVRAQIRRYQDDVREKRRATDDEFGDLVKLVIRRPDSSEIFFLVGEQLARRSLRRPRLRAFVPRTFCYSLARRRVNRILGALFGRRIGGFARGPFSLEGRGLLFVRADPAGDACEIVTGLCQEVLRLYTGGDDLVIHDLCEGRRDQVCRWSVTQTDRAEAPERAPLRARLEQMEQATQPGYASQAG